jgi:hypothetical protein
MIFGSSGRNVMPVLAGESKAHVMLVDEKRWRTTNN